jgi:hypothetical protein
VALSSSALPRPKPPLSQWTYSKDEDEVLLTAAGATGASFDYVVLSTDEAVAFLRDAGAGPGEGVTDTDWFVERQITGFDGISRAGWRPALRWADKVSILGRRRGMDDDSV